MRTRFGQTLVSLMFLQMLTGFVSAQTMRVNPDSAFWQLSLPELQSYRGYYVQELESRQEEKRNLIQRGIEDGERLLAVGPDQDVIDDILIRLADLYYYKEKDDYFNEMATYDLQLSRYEQDQISERDFIDLSVEPALRDSQIGKREDRFVQTENPGEGEEEQDPGDHGGAQAQPACLGPLMLR